MKHAAVVIVGAGWAGLACAVELSRQGRPVILLESARQPGGRARRAPFGSLRVDNGQHLLMGACHETLRLMHLVGVDTAQALRRLPFDLHVVGGGEALHLKAPALPAPLHMAAALLTARGLSVGERLAALRCAAALTRLRLAEADDLPLGDLLQRYRQSPRLQRLLWAPLAQAILNTPPEHASSRLMARVLRDAMGRSRHDSDLLLFRTDLGSAFPDHAIDFIERHGGSVRLCSRATGLALEGQRVSGVALQDGTALSADAVVLAVPPYAALRLLPDQPALQATASQLRRLDSQPIATIYLRYPPSVRLPEAMIGLAEGPIQWLFDRALYGQHGLIAAIAGGSPPAVPTDNTALAAAAADAVNRLLGSTVTPLDHRVIREQRATFTARPGIDARRPGHATPLAGLWLAGDHTATGYPATLEGAVRSGVECARYLLQSDNGQP